MDSRKNTLSTSVTPYMQSEDEGDDLFMTRDEVTEVVKQFRIDRLNEFLKAPDVVALTLQGYVELWGSASRLGESGGVSRL